MATQGAAKALHNVNDMHRWAEVFGAPFKLPAAHPMRTVRALRVLLALPDSRWPAAIEALYAAYWQRAEDITKDDVIAAALRGAGVPDSDIAGALARGDEMKDELRRRTDEAIALGIFGAPAFVITTPRRHSAALRGPAEPDLAIRRGDSHVLLWGQDRMEWVREVLAGWDIDAAPPAATHPLAAITSTSKLDVYFDVASPFAYLGLTQLPALHANVVLHPILLGGLFRDIGQVDVPMFAMPAPKQRYVMLDMQRWARWWGVPFQFPTKFPQRTITAQRLCVIANESGDGVRLANALGRAMWAEQRNLEDADVLRGVLGDAGLPREWLERTSEPAVKQKLIDNTAAAAKRGVFGVPTWIVDDKYLFWGQDRLDLVARAMQGWRPQQ